MAASGGGLLLGDSARKVFPQCSCLGREEQTDSSSLGSFMFQLVGLNLIFFCLWQHCFPGFKIRLFYQGGDLMAACCLAGQCGTCVRGRCRHTAPALLCNPGSLCAALV